MSLVVSRAEVGSLEQRRRLQPRSDGVSLRELRCKHELSLRDVEKRTGIHRAVLSRVENGVEVPSPALLQRLSDLYGVEAASWKLFIEYRSVSGPDNRGGHHVEPARQGQPLA